MQDVDLLVEWIADIERIVRNEIETLSQDQIDWQPADQMNSIGHTVWHFSRWLDAIFVRWLQSRLPSQEQWHTRRTPGLDGERTTYSWLRPVIQGCLGHIGEIQTLKTLQTRTTP
jgi:hypothetical protein